MLLLSFWKKRDVVFCTKKIKMLQIEDNQRVVSGRNSCLFTVSTDGTPPFGWMDALVDEYMYGGSVPLLPEAVDVRTRLLVESPQTSDMLVVVPFRSEFGVDGIFGDSDFENSLSFELKVMRVCVCCALLCVNILKSNRYSCERFDDSMARIRYVFADTTEDVNSLSFTRPMDSNGFEDNLFAHPAVCNRNMRFFYAPSGGRVYMYEPVSPHEIFGMVRWLRRSFRCASMCRSLDLVSEPFWICDGFLPPRNARVEAAWLGQALPESSVWENLSESTCSESTESVSGSSVEVEGCPELQELSECSSGSSSATKRN